MNWKAVKLPGKTWPQYVVSTADWHNGNPTCHEEGIRRCVEDCKKHLWTLLGDVTECIAPGDKRYSVDEARDSVLASCSVSAELIRPAAETCLGLIEGNHEGHMSKLIGGVTQHIAKLAGVPFLGQTHYIHYKGAAKDVTHFVAHGTLTFRGRQGDCERRGLNRELSLRGYLGHFLADVAGLGHGHFGIVSPPIYRQRMTPDCKRRPIMEKSGWAYMTPAFYKVYGEAPSYAEAALLPAADMGWVRIYIDKSGEIPCIELVDEQGRVFHESRPKVIA